MIRLRDKLDFYSKIKYFVWKFSNFIYSYDLAVKMKNGKSIVIRPDSKSLGINSTDLGIACEMFVAEIYKPSTKIDSKNVKRIIDVGGNVGYSCIYWLNKFPNSHITVFEPHPKHLAQIYTHLKLNQAEKIVTVIPCGASNVAGQLFLTDMGGDSSITTEESENTISVPMIDLFEAVGTEEIDILKIDIEGGEYALLSDPRFADLKCKVITMEWHNTREYPDGYQWCVSRLEELNYLTVGEKGIDAHCGMLFAFPQ